MQWGPLSFSDVPATSRCYSRSVHMQDSEFEAACNNTKKTDKFRRKHTEDTVN